MTFSYPFHVLFNSSVFQGSGGDSIIGRLAADLGRQDYMITYKGG